MKINIKELRVLVSYLKALTGEDYFLNKTSLEYQLCFSGEDMKGEEIMEVIFRAESKGELYSIIRSYVKNLQFIINKMQKNNNNHLTNNQK